MRLAQLAWGHIHTLQLITKGVGDAVGIAMYRDVNINATNNLLRTMLKKGLVTREWSKTIPPSKYNGKLTYVYAVTPLGEELLDAAKREMEWDLNEA